MHFRFLSTDPSLLRLLSIMTCILCSDLQAKNSSGNQESRETQKRLTDAKDAHQLLAEGDVAYESGSYAKAVSTYKEALAKLPKAPKTDVLRASATDRVVTSSIQYARELSKKGDVAKAKQVIEDVLKPDIAPNSEEAQMMLGQLNDPIRTNPALDAEHARNVDAVRRELYTAEGAMQLGKFTEAKKHYEQVLRLDSTNTAAQRGIERVNQEIAGYLGAARDANRSRMLSDVESQWNEKPGQSVDMSEIAAHGQGAQSGTAELISGQNQSVETSAKLDRIILPSIVLENASIEEALDFLRAKTREYDKEELDPAKQGVNFALMLKGDAADADAQAIRRKRFTLRLNHVSVSTALKYITEQTGTAYQVDQYSVLLVPAGQSASGMMTRQFRVPSTFLATLEKAGGASEAPQSQDPFANNVNPNQTLTVKRTSVKDALRSAGIRFEEGSSVVYNYSTQMLVMRNTKDNLDLMSSLVDSAQKMTPVQVVVRVTMIKTEQQNLEELGFDWLLGPSSNERGEAFLTGGVTGNGSSLADVTTGTTGLTQLAPITSGLRSGSAQLKKGIDDFITSNNKGLQNGASNRAPGALRAFGRVSDADFAVALRALSQKKGIDLLNVPSVVTKSGTTAKLESVREFIYPTEYEAPQIPNTVGTNNVNTTGVITDPNDPNNRDQGAPAISPVTPATPTAFETKNIGVTLEVIPTISGDHQFVDLDIKADYIDFDGFIDYGSPIFAKKDVMLTPNAILMPVFSRLSEKTSLTVAVGQSIVMGGMIEEKRTDESDKVPILGDLPLLGRLFQNKGGNFVKKHVLFVVQVQVIDPAGQSVLSSK